MNYNSYAAASTSVLPLPWTEEARTHPLHLPFSASTPVITLSPPTTSDGIINEEPEDIALGSPLSPPTETQSPQSPVPPNGPVAPSQSTDETVHLALILAFGNDKYSSAHAPAPPMHKSYSTPPSYFPGRPKIPARRRFAHSPSPTPPQSPSSTPTRQGSREQSPRDSTSSEARSRPSSKQRTSDPSLEASARDQVPPLPPLDLRFESDYSSDSPTSAGSAGALGTGFKGQARRSTYNLNSQPLRKPEGTVMLPIPLMLRPRPIWRTTPRSALSSPAYSPASHLVRRSTFIAAGLDLDSPIADLSALSVETRALMFGRDAGVVLPGFDV